VNRSPAAGTITKMQYRPGKFLAAMLERASVENEQNVFTLSTEAGEIVFKQIGRTDRSKGCLLEESRRKGGSRRAHWTGTIRVTRGPVGCPKRRRSWVKVGREREGRFECAGTVAGETRIT